MWVRGLISAATLAIVVMTLLITPATAPAAATSRAPAWDFNGDGFRDLAVGVPNGTAGGRTSAGYVVVIPGSRSGPIASHRYVVSESSRGVPGSSEAYDRFGAQLASADLNSDGHAELIVSAPGENTRSAEDGGRVTILWGSRSGFNRGTTIGGRVDFDGLGGRGLAVADVTGDGRADIVAIGNGEEAEPIHVIAGPFAPGRTPKLTLVTHMPVFSTTSEFAVGDFNRDGRTDFAAAYSGFDGSGTVLLRGTSSGLVRADGWYRETTGHALVAGDFNADGYADLAYGNASTDSDQEEPRYPIAHGVGGTVRIAYGGPQGPAGTRPPVDISQETPGVPGDGTGDSEQDDRFGGALAAADINGDGYRDLAIGAPGEAIRTLTRAGAVTVLYGSRDGISAAGAQSFHQGTPNVSGSTERDDAFGHRVRLRDLNRDRRPDLVVGVPGENRDSGRVMVLPGSSAGVSAAGSKSYSPRSLSLPGSHTLRFGSTLG